MALRPSAASRAIPLRRWPQRAHRDLPGVVESMASEPGGESVQLHSCVAGPVPRQGGCGHDRVDPRAGSSGILPVCRQSAGKKRSPWTRYPEARPCVLTLSHNLHDLRTIREKAGINSSGSRFGHRFVHRTPGRSRDDEALFDAIMAGAAGYVPKQIRGTDLVGAVRTVASGQSMLDPRTASLLMAHRRADVPGREDGEELCVRCSPSSAWSAAPRRSRTRSGSSASSASTTASSSGSAERGIAGRQALRPM